MIITLTPDLERALAKAAQEMGTTPEQLALESLQERFTASTDEPAQTEATETLADFLQGHIGVLNSAEHVPGGAHMSQDSSGKFAAGLAVKHHHQQSS